ncbi:MAG: hypothetical protein JJ902_21940 [Roseibium sp.]|nr:hypothetical protein [Roseibium sp.]
MRPSVSPPGLFKKQRQILFAGLAVLAFILTATLQAHAQAPYEPARGTAERKDILNAVRPLVEARLNPPVEFVVTWMRVAGGWAFVGLAPQRPGGGQINLRATIYANEADYMDGAQTYALLRKAYGRWNIVDFAVGPTDVFWHGDPLYFGLPRGLTP